MSPWRFPEGCIIGVPMHWVIFVSLITNIWGTAWSVPFVPLGSIIAIVLFASFLAVRRPAKRLHDMSIVENSGLWPMFDCLRMILHRKCYCRMKPAGKQNWRRSGNPFSKVISTIWDGTGRNPAVSRSTGTGNHRRNGRKHMTIKIYFTYVGKIRIPLQKPKLPASTEKPAWFPPRRFYREISFISLWASA